MQRFPSLHQIEGSGSVDIQGLIQFAKLAQLTNRYRDMNAFVRDAILADVTKITEEIRLLFGSGVKAEINQLKEQFSQLKLLLESDNNDKNNNNIVQLYMSHIINTIQAVALSAIQLIDTTLLPAANQEEIVFYLKLKGDQYRYLCDLYINDNNECSTYCNLCTGSYLDALKAADILPHNSLVKLGLILNYSVWLASCGNKVNAIEIVRNSIEKAQIMGGIEPRGKILLDILGQNLNIWINENN